MATIGQLWRATLSTFLLFALPREPYSLVNKYPLSTISAIKLIHAHNQANLVLLGLALVFDTLFDFRLTIGAMSEGRHTLLRALLLLKDGKYTLFNTDDLSTSTEERKIIETSSIYEYLGSQGLPFAHIKDVTIVHVEPGESGAMLDSICTYHTPFISSHILISEMPESLDAYERFKLCHEIGHSLGLEFVEQARYSKGIKLVSFAVLLALPLYSLNSLSIGILGILGMALLIAMSIIHQQEKYFRLTNEIRADECAIAMLAPSEQEELWEEVTELPKDEDLDLEDHLYRQACFRARLKSQTEAPASLNRIQMNAWRNFWSNILIGTNLLIAIYLFSVSLKPITQWHLNVLIVIDVVLFALGFFKWLRFYWAGFQIDWIFDGSWKWQDGMWRHRYGWTFKLPKND